MKTAVFILAGGSGIRLWPLSRFDRPKQFLPVFSDGSSFFDKTLKRAKKITSPENIFILTGKDYADIVRKTAEDIPEDNILTETVKRNTAPVIAYRMMQLQEKQGNTTAVILPSDHHITDENLFCHTVKNACNTASETNGIVTIGIPPTRPATSYGYINLCSEETDRDFYKAISFTEKPDFATAKKFLLSSSYLWNSGIFVWNTDTIINSFMKNAPEIFEKAKKMCECPCEEQKEQIFSEMPSISIDYAILEKEKNLYAIKGNFGWDDIGSWERYENLLPEDNDNNRSDNNSTLINTSECTAISVNSKTIMMGTQDIFVINTGDAVLIFPKSKANEIGNLSDILKKNGFENLM